MEFRLWGLGFLLRFRVLGSFFEGLGFRDPPRIRDFLCGAVVIKGGALLVIGQECWMDYIMKSSPRLAYTLCLPLDSTPLNPKSPSTK